jgi:MFS superfamily sulfate permease-like transporter
LVSFLTGIVVGITLGVLLMAVMMNSKQSAREGGDTRDRAPLQDNSTEPPPPELRRE